MTGSDDGPGEGRQKRHRFTGAGREDLERWLRTPADLTSPPRDELVIKVLVARRMPEADVHDVIQAHRRYLVELMQQWPRLKDDEGEFDFALALVVDGRLKRFGPEQPRTAATIPLLRRRLAVSR